MKSGKPISAQKLESGRNLCYKILDRSKFIGQIAKDVVAERRESHRYGNRSF